jgi:beta-glucanase (GH16 family)
MLNTRTLALAAVLSTMGCGSDAAPTTTTTTPPPPPPPTITWTQVWGDEFDGAAGSPVDDTKWAYDTGDGCSQNICGWGNNEKEYYTTAADNISLNGNGQLVIVAHPTTGVTCYYGACRYTSAKITTRGKMVASPGRVEARIKLPTGQGLWPAFWLLGSTCPQTPWPDCGELDIMENKGSQPTTTSSAVHGPGYSGQTPFAHANVLSAGSVADNFHTYAVQWDSTHVFFFVDDALHYQVTRGGVEQYGRSILGYSFIVILDLAVGGHFDGDPASDAIFPATMTVDYVRVFKPETK